MKDVEKTTDHLIAELNALRQRVNQLEQIEARQQHVETALQERLGIEQLVVSLSTRFINLPPDEIDQAITDALQTIGQFANVDRTHLLQLSADGTVTDDAYEWCAPGVEAQIDRLKNLTPNRVSWLMKQLRQQKNIHIPSVANLPPEAAAVKEILEANQVVSMLIVPIAIENRLVGLMNLSSTRQQKVWSQPDVQLLRLTADIFASILARKQTEEKLREERQLLRTLIDNLPDYIYIKDNRHRFIVNNAAHIKALGKKHQDEVRGKTDLDLFPHDLAWEYYTDEEQVLSSGQTLTKPEEFVINQTTGRQMWVSVTKAPLRDSQGKITGLVGISRDISAQKQTKQELERLLVAERQQRELAETLRDVTLALAAQTHPETLLDEILAQVERLLPFDTASIMLLEGNVLKFARGRGFEKFVPAGSETHFDLPLSHFSLEASALKSQTPIVIPDTRQEPAWIVVREWIKSHIAIPICHGNRVWGILQLDSEKPDTYAENHIQLLEPFTSAAALALENTRLYQQTRQDAEIKSTLLREVNHRVGNTLTAISGMLALERSQLDDADEGAYKAIMEDLNNRINGLATVHNMLSATEWSPLSLDELISQVIYSSLQMLPFNKHVAVNVTPSTIKIPSEQAHNLALVINELATNSIKYALTDRDTAAIFVNISSENDNTRLEFRDDGPGFPKSVLNDADRSVGLLLVDSLMRSSLQGTWTIFNDAGAVTVLQFKLESEPSTASFRS